MSQKHPSSRFEMVDVPVPEQTPMNDRQRRYNELLKIRSCIRNQRALSAVVLNEERNRCKYFWNNYIGDATGFDLMANRPLSTPKEATQWVTLAQCILDSYGALVAHPPALRTTSAMGLDTLDGCMKFIELRHPGQPATDIQIEQFFNNLTLSEIHHAVSAKLICEAELLVLDTVRIEDPVFY